MDRNVAELFEKLKAVQQACAGKPAEERLRSLQAALAEELRPGTDGDARLAALRGYLAGQGGDAARQLDTLTSEVSRLREEVRTLRDERDRLQRQLTVLEPAGGAAATGSEDGSLERLRAGLLQIAEDRKVSAEEAKIPAEQAVLFQTMTELLRFALDLEIGLQGFLRASEVGEVGMMGTRQFAEHERIIRSRFRACLQKRDASVEPLKEVLGSNLRFLLGLHSAYDTSIEAGTRAILALLEPQQILEETRGRLGLNHQEAWKKISRLLTELGALDRGEIWERYFETPFREQLRKSLPERRPTRE